MNAFATVAAVALLAASAPASSATYNLGLLDSTRAIYHAFSNYTGDFTDVYTFTLPGSVNTVAGDTTSVNIGNLVNVSLYSASLSGSGIDSPMMDFNPNDSFSFAGLSGEGSYSLSIKGRVKGTGLGGTSGLYAGYISAVPEPAAVGLAIVGLLATGLALRRRT